MTTTPPAVLTVSTPADLLPLVPHLIGYQPMDAVVVMCLNGSLVGMCMVLGSDIDPEYVTPADIDRAVVALTKSEPTAAFVLCYETITGGSAGLAHRVAEALRVKGLDLTDRLVITPTAWRHAACSCCPSEGNPLPSEESAAAQTYRKVKGTAPAASRAALRARFTPTPRAAEVERTCAALQGEGTPTAHAGIIAWGSILGSETPVADLPASTLATAALSLAHGTLRDTLVMALCPGLASALGLGGRNAPEPTGNPWNGAEPTPRDLTRALDRVVAVCADLPDAHVAQPLATLAAACWWHGHSALGSIAAERALLADSSCRLAQLVHTALQFGVPPQR